MLKKISIYVIFSLCAFQGKLFHNFTAMGKCFISLALYNVRVLLLHFFFCWCHKWLLLSQHLFCFDSNFWTNILIIKIWLLILLLTYSKFVVNKYHSCHSYFKNHSSDDMIERTEKFKVDFESRMKTQLTFKLRTIRLRSQIMSIAKSLNKAIFNFYQTKSK